MKFGVKSYIWAALPYVVLATSAPTPRQKELSSSVRTIIRAHCVTCHGATDPSAGLNLTTDAGILSISRVQNGDASSSLILQRVLGHGGKPRMPLGFAPLSTKDTALLAEWISAGTPLLAEPKKHWAYLPVVRPKLPPVSRQNWCRNDIDRFILAKLDKAHLSPSPEAPRETLIRRLYLDLIGLPPGPKEVEAFLNDRSGDAYERVVDRLLASPQYGERQARPWLDLARYADTNGYEADYSRTVWPYRDWLIDALNRNEPYDEFTLDQLAGDLRPGSTLAQRVATGFNRNVMFNTEGGVDQGEQRWLRLVDMVGTTSQAWLGTTLQCAQCHDHKYDPFSQKDFYRFLAFFESADTPTQDLRPELEPKRKAMREEIEKIQLKLKAASESERPLIQSDLDQAQKSLETLSGPTTLTLAENLKVRPQTLLRIRGGYLSPGERVDANTPKSLPAMGEWIPKNRLGLARWLVSPSNPLTARVQVNRMWETIFGRGLVETSENFGTQGSPPTHPELLDWLASEFMRRKWDMKAMNKLIVMSATYRQSSATNPRLRKIDPENTLLARGPRYRLEAELVRDNALSIAGLLSLKRGGPSVFPSQPEGVWDSPYSGETWTPSKGEDRYRRGIYTFWKRTATYPAFTVLDATSRENCTVRRIRTNTPLQALALLNDPMYLEAARGLAKRMWAEAGPSVPRQIELAFRYCTARKPTQKELYRLEDLYSKVIRKYESRQAAARKLAADPESAARTLVANVLLNMDETITKE
jgi:cytochrome c553